MHIFDVKIARGDKPLEDFVLLTVLDKGDATEYMVPTANLVIPLTLFLHSCSNMFSHFLRHRWSVMARKITLVGPGGLILGLLSVYQWHDRSQNVISVLDGGDDQERLYIRIKHQINFWLVAF